MAGWEAESYFGTGTLRRLGKEIAASDVFGHLLSVHTKDIDRHHGGVYPFRDEGWNSNVTFQGLETYSLDEKGRVLRKQHTGRQPVYAQETIWVGNDLQARGFSLEDLRKGMWVHMMSATAFNNGDMDGNNTSGFSGSLDFADKVQARHDIPKMIWDFMETVPFYQMRPRQDLVTEGFCLAEAGAAYLVYLPNGGRTDVDVERGRTYEVTWVNARNPAKQAPGGKTKDGRGLRAPDTDDWVLHLRRVKDDAPSEPVTNKPPVVALEAPADGDVFAAPADLRIEADASDADGSVVKVAFYADGAKLGEDRRPPFAYDWTGVAAGSYRLTAEATDDDGARTTSPPVTVNVAGRAGGAITDGPDGEPLPVARVTASASQRPNVPANTLDGDTATRWSALGKGQWIRYDLGERAAVDRIGVAWYRGNERYAHFEVETSADGKAWTRVFSGRSSGRSRQVETYDVADRDARYVRIVGRGTSRNDWNAITEVEIYGASSGNGGTEAAPAYVWLEAEAGSPTAPLRVRRSDAASAGRYVEAPGDRYSKAAPPADGRASYRFSVAQAGTYRVWGRVIAANTGSDSFWIRMDGGDWVRWNEIDAGRSWRWDAVHDADEGNAVVGFRLSSGAHTLEVAYRERSARLDKLLVTDDLAYVPSGTGGAAPAAAKAGSERATSLEQAEIERAPASYRLEENYPNPFNPSTTITYHLPEAATVTLSVYNAVGQRVATLVSGQRVAGTHRVRWDSRDAAGVTVPSGLYFYRIEAGGFRQTRKMLLLK